MTGTTIDYDAWTTGDDGEVITQISSQDTITRLLDLLDVQPGHRVLEVGTGSGYSTARIAELTGPTGSVVSIDVEQYLVERATQRLTESGLDHVHVITGDGLLGAPQHQPFDRIIAWTTPPAIPQTWLDQAATHAMLVTPIHLAPVAHAHAVLLADITSSHLHPKSLHPGSFIETHQQTPTDFRIPPRFVDALTTTTADDTPYWLSASSLRDKPAAAHELLIALVEHGTTDSDAVALDRYQDWQSAIAHVMTTHPDRACSATGPWGLGYGLATETGIALLTRNGALVRAGAPTSADELHATLRRWIKAGKPDLTTMPPAV